MSPVRASALAVGLLLLLPLAPGPEFPALSAQATDGSTVVFLVRHAEKVADDSDDPALNARGRERARRLAHTLKDADIDRVHSTDTRRTRRTAAPLAENLAVEVEIYDGTALERVTRRLRSAPGRHLVVGHSNTTPELVELLGGDPGSPIVEAWEYDRLYVVTLEPGGAVRTVLLRYGRPAAP